jgi:hypothetical protein
VILDDILLPFGEFLSEFYRFRPDVLANFKERIRDFLVFKAKKDVVENRLFLVNPIYLLDLYIPPANVLFTVRLVDINGKEKFSLEMSNYVIEVINIQEQKPGFFAEEGEKVYVEFYMIHDELFKESVKNLKSSYQDDDSIYESMDLSRKRVVEKIEEDLRNIGYDLVMFRGLFSEIKAEEIIKIMPNLIKEVA